MTHAASNWARNIRPADPLAPTERLLLMILADMAGATGQCWPKHSTLADEMGVSEDTVARAFKALRDRDLVSWERRAVPGGMRRENVYTLHLHQPALSRQSAGTAPAPVPGSVPAPMPPSVPAPVQGLTEPPLEPSEEPNPPVPPQPPAAPLHQRVERLMQDYLAWRQDQGMQPAARQVMVRLRAQVRDAMEVGTDVAVIQQAMGEWTHAGTSPGGLAAFIDRIGRGVPAGGVRHRPVVEGKAERGSRLAATLAALSDQPPMLDQHTTTAALDWGQIGGQAL